MYPPSSVTATAYDREHRMLLVAICASLGCLILGVLLGWRLLVEQAYLVPPGGPGLAKPGVLDDATAKDYAKRWFQAKWNFRPETFEEMKEELLASVHGSYRDELKAELGHDGRITQQYRISSYMRCFDPVRMVSRKGQTVRLALHCTRTLSWGGEEQLPEYIDAQVVVTLMTEGGRLRDVVTAKSSATPGFSATGLEKGKK